MGEQLAHPSSSPSGGGGPGRGPGPEGVNGLASPTPKASVLYRGEYGVSLTVIDRENPAALGWAMTWMKSTTTGDVRGVGLVMGMWTALAG